MSTMDFYANCKVCNGKVDSFVQQVKFILTADEAIQEYETIQPSCGCVIDFPVWNIDISNGLCQIANYAGTVYLEFYDVELIAEEDL